MKLDVLSTAGAVLPVLVENKTVCVIDVFRATSVMVTALDNGAAGIIPVTRIEDAFACRQQLAPGHNVILGGERKALQIEGFDKDNSPLSYPKEEVEGTLIIMSTTNGTRAINNASSAASIYIGAFLNARAVCDKMLADGRDLVIICAGRQDRLTLEDNLCAGWMADYICTVSKDVSLSDEAWISRELYRNHKNDLSSALLQGGLHYRQLLQMGRNDDIRYCLQINTTESVPYLNPENVLIL